MKKIYKVLLVCLLCLGIVGCSKDDATIKKIPDTSSNNNTNEMETKKEDVKKEKFNIDYHFLNNSLLRWNMSSAEAKHNIPLSNTGKKSSGSTEYLEYSSYTANNTEVTSQYVFAFPDNKLKTYFVQFDKYPDSSTDYISLYNDVKQKVISLYGAPTTENYNWTDETYKGNEAEWNKGLKYEYLTIEAQWLSNNDKDIVIRWSYKDGFYLMMCEKGYIPSL